MNMTVPFVRDWRFAKAALDRKVESHLSEWSFHPAEASTVVAVGLTIKGKKVEFVSEIVRVVTSDRVVVCATTVTPFAKRTKVVNGATNPRACGGTTASADVSGSVHERTP